MPMHMNPAHLRLKWSLLPPPIRVTQLHFRTDQENNGDLQTAQKPLRAEEYLSHITALRISCTTKQLAHSGIELPERTA